MSTTTVGTRWNISALWLACLLATSPAAADKVSHAEAVEIANTFAECSGYYRYLEDIYSAEGKTASAEHMGNLANGAKSTALYHLAMEWTIDHPNDRRTYASFAPMVDGRIDAALVRFKALAENDDFEALVTQGKFCVELLPTQEEAVQALRSQSVGNQ